jgi:hypothetical protein
LAEKFLVTQEDLADGARLIQELDQAGFPVTAAFWAHDALLESWRLIIASPRQAIDSLVNDVVEVSAGRTEIAGRVLDDIHLYKSDALRYENDLVTALRRIQPENSTIMRTYPQEDLPRYMQADVVLYEGDRVVLVEVKARTRPIGARDVLQVEGILHAYERNLGRRPAAMIVSRSGFTVDAAEAARGSGIRLVQWAGPKDNSALEQTLAEVRGT